MKKSKEEQTTFAKPVWTMELKEANHSYDDGGYRVEEMVVILNVFPATPVHRNTNPIVVYVNPEGQIKQDFGDKFEMFRTPFVFYPLPKGTRKPLVEVNPPPPEEKEEAVAEQNKSANTETTKGT